jgi:hypothetical protein
LKSVRWATAVTWRKASRKYKKQQISRRSSRIVSITQSQNLVHFTRRKLRNCLAYIRHIDALYMTLSESVKLSLTTALVQFWKTAKAIDQKHKYCCNKPLVIKKKTLTSHYSPDGTFSLPLDLSQSEPPHTTLSFIKVSGRHDPRNNFLRCLFVFISSKSCC